MISVERITELANSFGRRIGRVPMVVGGIVLVAVVAILLFLAQDNWNFLRGPIAGFASARTGRAVRLDGNPQQADIRWTVAQSSMSITG